jgi:hypothetical protein
MVGMCAVLCCAVLCCAVLCCAACRGNHVNIFGIPGHQVRRYRYFNAKTRGLDYQVSSGCWECWIATHLLAVVGTAQCWQFVLLAAPLMVVGLGYPVAMHPVDVEPVLLGQ